MSMKLQRYTFLAIFLFCTDAFAQEAPAAPAAPPSEAEESAPTDDASTDDAPAADPVAAPPSETSAPPVPPHDGSAGSFANPQEKAVELSEEGKDLFREWSKTNQPELLNQAADKFRQALLFSPEAKYYFNLCYILDKAERYRDAITACESVAANDASDRLKQKANGLLVSIRKNLTSGGGETASGHATNNNTDKRGGVIPFKPTTVATGENISEYTWSAGADVGFVNSDFGPKGSFGGQGVKVSFNASLLLSKTKNIGAKVYLGVLEVPKGNLSGALHVAEFGVGAYKHFKIKNRIFATPFAGLHFATLGSGGESLSDSTTVQSNGLRLQAAISMLHGLRNEHVFSVGLGLSTYTAPSDQNAAGLGLANGGTTAGLFFSYTYRDSHPFGATFFALE